MSEFRPDTPPLLALLIQRLMGKEREDRPATGVELLHELRAIDDKVPPTIVDTPVPSAQVRELPDDVAQLLKQGNALMAAAIQGGTGSRGKLELAKVYFEKALARAPESAIVMVALSDVVNVMGVRGFTDITAAQREAHEIRLRALALDDTIGEVHTGIGYTFLYWEDEFELAGAELRKGAELSPRNAIGPTDLWRLAEDCGAPDRCAGGDARRGGRGAQCPVHVRGTRRRAHGARPL